MNNDKSGKGRRQRASSEERKQMEKERNARKNAKKREKIQAMTPEERKAYYKKYRDSRKPLTGEKLEKRIAAKAVASKRSKDKKKAEIAALPKNEQQKLVKARREKVNKYNTENREKVNAKRRTYWSTMSPKIKGNRLRYKQANGSQPVVCVYCRKTVISTSLKKHQQIHIKSARLHLPLSPEERAKIELETRGGPGSKKGQAARQYVVTGTRAHNVVSWHRRKKDLAKLAENYTRNSRESYQTPAMKEGSRLEPQAIIAYQKAMKIPEQMIQKKVGLLVHPRRAYLRATPDGCFTRNDGLKGSLEVKYVEKGIESAGCLKSKKSRVWTTGKGGEYLTSKAASKPKLQLNRNHCYFTQVVMQIMCGEKDFGEFVVYTKRKNNPEELELWRETISRKEAEKHWKVMEPIFIYFFNTFLGPPELTPK